MGKRKRGARIPGKRLASKVAGQQALNKAEKAIREALVDANLGEQQKREALVHIAGMLAKELEGRARVPRDEARRLAFAWTERVAFDVTDRLHELSVELSA